MVERKRLICDAEALADGGKGLRFTVERNGKEEPAFAIRHRGTVHAYVNRCAHVPIELDWAEGEFFDFSGLYLVCSTHGAAYLPASGRCISGPCSGRGLVPLTVEESNGQVYLIGEQ